MANDDARIEADRPACGGEAPDEVDIFAADEVLIEELRPEAGPQEHAGARDEGRRPTGSHQSGSSSHVERRAGLLEAFEQAVTRPSSDPGRHEGDARILQSGKQMGDEALWWLAVGIDEAGELGGDETQAFVACHPGPAGSRPPMKAGTMLVGDGSDSRGIDAAVIDDHGVESIESGEQCVEFFGAIADRDHYGDSTEVGRRSECRVDEPAVDEPPSKGTVGRIVAEGLAVPPTPHERDAGR